MIIKKQFNIFNVLKNTFIQSFFQQIYNYEDMSTTLEEKLSFKKNFNFFIFFYNKLNYFNKLIYFKKNLLKLIKLITKDSNDAWTQGHEWWLWWSGSDIIEKFKQWQINNNLEHVFAKVKKFNNFKYRFFMLKYYNWQAHFLLPASFYYYKKEFKYTFSKKDILHLNTMTRVFTFKLPEYRVNLFFFVESIFTLCKSIIISFIISFFFFIFFINYFSINLIKQLGIWIIIGSLFFWLISGFNFFLKRYEYSKFTAVISRFWKRTNVYFWLTEGFLFILFTYYYLNSSQEPVYMYDYNSLMQTYLPNLYNFYLNIIFLVFIICYFYFWFMNYNHFYFQQNIFNVIIVILGVLYIYLVESYQFYYLLNYFTENIWIYDNSSNIWVLDYETPKTRVRQQYFIFLLIAKYLHFIFIFIALLFWSIKSFEQKKFTFTLTGWNIQNLLILFWLNIVFILYWLKWIYRRFYDSIFFWFFTDFNFYRLKFLLLEIFNVLIFVV